MLISLKPHDQSLRLNTEKFVAGIGHILVRYLQSNAELLKLQNAASSTTAARVEGGEALPKAQLWIELKEEQKEIPISYACLAQFIQDIDPIAAPLVHRYCKCLLKGHFGERLIEEDHFKKAQLVVLRETLYQTCIAQAFTLKNCATTDAAREEAFQLMRNVFYLCAIGRRVK